MGYCTRSDIEIMFGAMNVSRWADLDNSGSDADINARITRAIDVATQEVDSILAGSPIRVPIPSGRVPPLIRDVTAAIAGVILYESRGPQGTIGEDGQVMHPYLFKRRWAERILVDLREGRRKIAELV